MIKETLNEMGEILNQKRFKCASYLQDGVNKDYIESLFLRNNLTFKLPPELFELYEWRNGQRDIYLFSDSEFEIFPHLTFYSIEDVIQIYESNKQYIGVNYFPIFGCVDTLHDVIDLTNNSCDYGSIKDYDPEDIYKLKKYRSLKDMMEANFECYKVGAYYPDSNGLFCENDKISIKIHKKHGKGCNYWDRVEG